MEKSGRDRLFALTGSVALAAGSLLGGTVRASTTLTRTSAAQKTEWNAAYQTGSACGEVNEATIYRPVAGATTSSSRTDAFDGAMKLRVFPAADTDSGLSSEPFEYTEDATVVDFGPSSDASITGTCSATVQAQNLSAEVSTVFDRDRGEVTVTAVVTNEDDAAFSGFLVFESNMGSDGATVVELTSSGDNVVSSDDTWIISSENGEYTAGWDPVVLHVMNTAGAYPGPDTDFNAGNDDLHWRLPVSNLAPGSSVTFSETKALFLTPEEAEDSPLLGANLGANPAVPVPALPHLGLLALAAGLGLFGSLGLTRRNKRGTVKL